MKRLTLIALPFAAGLVLALAACGGEDATSVGEVPTGTSPTGTEPSDGDAGTPTETSTGDEAGTDDETGSGDGSPASRVRYKLWFVRGEGITTVDRSHAPTQRIGTAALQDLLAGPTEEERVRGLSTSIPEGTRLLGLVVSNGIATVDLSSEYESGGGTLSMTARLAQVTCTLDRFSTVDGVRFELDGEPVDVFSGEGIILDHPVSCGDYDELVLDQPGEGEGGLPAIVVERPRPGAELTSGARVTGNANVFEANVGYELVVDDLILDDGFTTATCGTGCRGDYSFRLQFAVDEPTDAILVVHDDDAAGTGQPPHEVRIPVRLLPS
jgi:germination protein M